MSAVQGPNPLANMPATAFPASSEGRMPTTSISESSMSSEELSYCGSICAKVISIVQRIFTGIYNFIACNFFRSRTDIISNSETRSQVPGLGTVVQPTVVQPTVVQPTVVQPTEVQPALAEKAAGLDRTRAELQELRKVIDETNFLLDLFKEKFDQEKFDQENLILIKKLETAIAAATATVTELEPVLESGRVLGLTGLHLAQKKSLEDKIQLVKFLLEVLDFEPEEVRCVPIQAVQDAKHERDMVLEKKHELELKEKEDLLSELDKQREILELAIIHQLRCFRGLQLAVGAREDSHDPNGGCFRSHEKTFEIITRRINAIFDSGHFDQKCRKHSFSLMKVFSVQESKILDELKIADEKQKVNFQKLCVRVEAWNKALELACDELDAAKKKLVLLEGQVAGPA